MPPLREDELEDSSDLEDEIENGMAKDIGEDEQTRPDLEEDDEGFNRTPSAPPGSPEAPGNGEVAVDAQNISNAESASGEASEDGDSDEEAVGAVKIRPADAPSDGDAESDAASSGEDNEGEEGSVVDAEVAAGAEELSDMSNGSDTSEDEVEEFQASSGSEEEEVAVERNSCVFCKQGEEDDPSEDFEPYLTCSVCGDHSHQQCARDHNAMSSDNDAEKWRCPTCVDNNLEAQSPQSPESKASKPRNSAPRLVRDLLPVSRGVQRPDSHSIFAQPLISEGRLRKRKSPTGEPQPPSEKRRRKVTPRALSTSNSNEIAEEAKSDAVKMDLDTPLATRSTRRASHKAVPLVRVIQQRPYHKDPPYKFILAFHLEQSKIANILSKPSRPRKSQRRDRRRVPKIPPPPPVFEPPIPKFPALPTNHLIFPLVLTERENELNSKPYGGILSESDADTSRSLPAIRDREIFEAARKEAEEERRKTSAAADGDATGDGTTTAARTSRTVSGPPTKIKCIQFGKFVIDTFYASPYPEEYSHESRLFICEFCLKYLPSEFVAYRHKLKCPAKHPPGDEIYRDGTVSIWEVDGRKKTEYCQCLCLMAKMFLGSKTLYYDVEPFLFYILTEYDELGYHFVGYFSKEKRPASLNNVSCILVMPIHQRKGYATFLIDFSYLLTRIEGKEGSPEKPLSDMGLTAYRSYWDLTISRHLLDLGLKPFSTRTLMDRTGMTADDVIHSLERLYAFIRDPITKTYAIRFDQKLYSSIVESNESKGYRQLKPGNLVWTPYVMGRSDHAMLDDAPMQTMAPREGEDGGDDGQSSKGTKQAGPTSAKAMNGATKDDSVCDEEAVNSPKGPSPTKSKSRSKSESSKAGDDSRSVNGDAAGAAPVDRRGHIAPGPPPTSTIDTAITQMTPGELRTNGIPNGTSSSSQGKSAHDEAAARGEPEPEPTGYALAYRTLGIPPTRFQIDPAIPPSMLRSRSTKKRSYGGAFGRRPPGVNGSAASSAIAAQPVRSSPRNASTANSSEANGSEKASTPIRRSARGSKLATELVSLDGPAEDDTSEDQDGEPEYAEKKEESTSSASEVEAEAGEEDSDEDEEEADGDSADEDENEEEQDDDDDEDDDDNDDDDDDEEE